MSTFKYNSIILLLMPYILFGIQDSALFKKDLRLINVPVAGIHTKPDNQSSYDSQQVYGHLVEVIETINKKWVKIHDGEVKNHCQQNDLIPDNIVWRTSNGLMRIKSITGCVYPEQNVYGQTIIRLPYNAYIKTLDQSEDKKWTHVELIDGTRGWMMSGDLEAIRIMSVNEIIERAKQFVGLPYIWGGVSSCGYDCSGFAQTLAQQMGYDMLRNSRSQANDPNLIPVDYDDLQPGDFVYFGKERINHVALYIGPNTIIHSATIGDTPRLMITPMDLPQLHFQCARRIPPKIN